MNVISTFAEDLREEFKGYNLTGFTKDLMAGMTVAAVALPLAIAFGVGSGATAAAGLVTAIIGGIVIGFFSGASFQISGPTGAMTAILVTLSAKYGMQGILIACFLAGVMLVAAGILRLGRMIYFIPASVITGFTSGIAIIIALGQLDNLFNVKSTGDLAITKFLSYFTEGFNPDLPTALIGFLVILIMILWPKKWNEKVPSSLAALVIILIINRFAKLDVAIVGDIPKTILLDERLTLGVLQSSQIWDFFIPALSIAALAMIESLLCGASAGKMKHEKLNGDRELIAQGIGNMVIPLFGGVPATAAIARTSVGIKAGSGTRVTGLVHSIILLLSMFILAPVMSNIPLSALSGVLIVTAWRMNDWENIHFVFDHKFKSGIAKFFITMGATVVLDLTQAIIIGVAFSSILIMIRLTDIDIHLSEIDNGRLEEIGVFIPQISSKVRIAYLTGTIFFAVVDKMINQLSELDNTKVLILSMRGVPVIDVSGVQGLIELINTLREHGIEVMFTSVQPKVLDKMRRGGILELVGDANVFRSAEEAIITAHTHL